MKNVVLHVGHGKTGSSYLQSVFAINSELLQKSGVLYPAYQGQNKAAKGYISSGNHSELSIDTIENAEQNTVLFSSERLFNSLLKGDLLENISSKFNLKVVLYTRDVVDNAVSRWAQFVKRGGVIQDVDSYLDENAEGPYKKVVTWIEKSKQLNFELILRNYSLHKNDLAVDFFGNTLLENLNLEDLQYPKAKKVNRSLTHSENEIQRIFNFLAGEKSATYVSDHVVNEFPDLEPHSIKISQKSFDMIVEKNAPSVRAINQFLSKEERVRYGRKEKYVNDSEGESSLSTEVIASLGESIKNNFVLGGEAPESKKVEKEPKPQGDLVKLLRVTALKIEKGVALDLSDALELMKAAQKMRPKGDLINRKVDEWSETLTAEETVEA